MERGALTRGCGICGTEHEKGSCPTLVRALGAIDHTAALAPTEGGVDPLLGIEVGGYELVSVLGSGSFGVVYRAVRRESGEAVALKLLHGHLAHDAEVVRRFVGEARATLLVAHPNVVQVKAIDALEGTRYYIVYELLEGETLEARLERGPFRFAEAAQLLRQLCDALGAAHAVGIVHRDLKPENIFLAQVDHRPTAKVMDFGVARRAYLSSGENRTQAGMVLGTPQYLSPEQSMGKEVDQRADVYALGVIMFRMLTGRLPFEAASAVELILAHRSQPPPRPSTIVPTLPPAADGIVLKALAKAPADRHQAMDKLEAELAGALADLEAQGQQRSSPTMDLLLALEATPADGHYRLLGVREGADVEGIRRAAQRLWQRFDVARATADAGLFVRLDSAAKRVALAEEVLLQPRRRAAFDAERGNFVGVARAIASGLDPGEVARLRADFVKGRPQLLDRRLPSHAPPATPAEQDALALELARLLKADPLNLELHRRYWPLRTTQKHRGTTGLGPRTA